MDSLSSPLHDRLSVLREDATEILALIGLPNGFVNAASRDVTGNDDVLITSLRTILANKPLASPGRWEAIAMAAEAVRTPLGANIIKEVEAVLHGQAEVLEQRAQQASAHLASPVAFAGGDKPAGGDKEATSPPIGIKDNMDACGIRANKQTGISSKTAAQKKHRKRTKDWGSSSRVLRPRAV